MLKTPQRDAEPESPLDHERRALGIYYTPDAVSAALCDWAVRAASDKVLEPSFGGCVFLVHAAAKLRECGASRPFAQLYGCDVDKRAFTHLENAFPKRGIDRRFIKGDFLSIAPSQAFASGMDAVVGNPPYVSNHNMTAAQRRSARRSADTGLLAVRATASLWAHFVNHSLKFLRDNGRVAMVLPGTAFRTDYGQKLLFQISRRFARVDVVQLQQRIFDTQGVREMPAILLCDGWNDGNDRNSALTHSTSTLEECSQLIRSLRDAKTGSKYVNDTRFDAAMSIFRKIGHHSLGDLASVKIGVVTGANHFFALRSSDCKELRIPSEFTTPFLSQVSMTPGLEVRRQDVSNAVRRNDRCLLLNPPERVAHRAIQAYLNSFPKKERDKNVTFKKRGCWFRPIEGEIPDAFLSYMNALGARLVVNSAGLQSLNNIHRLYFDSRIRQAQVRLAALMFLSTPGQLAAELLGRSYSGGVLKLEPSDAGRMPIPGCGREILRTLESGWLTANAFLRDGNYESAVAIADSVISKSCLDVARDFRTARELLAKVRSDRMAGRSSQAAIS